MVLQREAEIDRLKKALAEQRQLTEEVCQAGFCRENVGDFWEDMTKIGIELDRTHELKVTSEDPWKFGICWRKTEVWAAKQGLNLVLPTELGDVLHLVKKMVGFMGFMGT